MFAFLALALLLGTPALAALAPVVVSWSDNHVGQYMDDESVKLCWGQVAAFNAALATALDPARWEHALTALRDLSAALDELDDQR